MRSLRIIVAILFVTSAGFGEVASQTTKDLSTLSWMTGTWSGVKDGVELEEHWLAPKGNTMLGVHRDVKGGKTISFEFLRIDSTPEAITYWASPGGRPATPFRMAETRDRHVVFENLKHDFPQRVIYWIDKEGSLHAKIEGMMGGKEAAEEWIWKRSEK